MTQEQRHWTEEDWEKWHEQTNQVVFDSLRTTFVRYRLKVKHDVMVWACFSGQWTVDWKISTWDKASQRSKAVTPFYVGGA